MCAAARCCAASGPRSISPAARAARCASCAPLARCTGAGCARARFPITRSPVIAATAVARCSASGAAAGVPKPSRSSAADVRRARAEPADGRDSRRADGRPDPSAAPERRRRADRRPEWPDPPTRGGAEDVAAAAPPRACAPRRELAPDAGPRGRLREPRHVRAVPTSVEHKISPRSTLFNGSEHPRTVAGIARSLGLPDVVGAPRQSRRRDRQRRRLLGAVLVPLRGRSLRRGPVVRAAGQGYELVRALRDRAPDATPPPTSDGRLARPPERRAVSGWTDVRCARRRCAVH